MNKKKLSRSSKDKGYYQRQFARTSVNKARRAARIKRRATASALRKLAEASAPVAEEST